MDQVPKKPINIVWPVMINIMIYSQETRSCVINESVGSIRRVPAIIAYPEVSSVTFALIDYN